MHRHELSDLEWQRLEPLLPPEQGRRGRPLELPNRIFLNAIFYVAKTGAPWRDLPERFGPWKTIHTRFTRWNRRQAQGENFIADKGDDANNVIEAIENKKMTVVIPSKSNRKVQRAIDGHLYKERHLVENFFCKIKRYRRVATRYEKTAANFLGFVLFASVRVWLA